MKKYVAYYRVSTKKQGNSGLGLQAQKEMVKNHIGNNEVIGSFEEIQSGKNNERTELRKAVSMAKEKNAVLIIAKLDRLSREVSFLFSLKDSGVNIECCELPELNTLTLGIFATMAQHERELISKRTKSALAAKKANGFKLGKPENLTAKSRERSIEVRKNKALNNENNRKAYALISELREKGLSYSKIAVRLNDFGFQTAKNKKFSAIQVQRLFNRYYVKASA